MIGSAVLIIKHRIALLYNNTKVMLTSRNHHAHRDGINEGFYDFYLFSGTLNNKLNQDIFFNCLKFVDHLVL